MNNYLLLLQVLQAASSLSWSVRQPRSGSVGQRERVRITGGFPRKLQKKRRRSQSPQLFPCVTSGGQEGWVRLAPSQLALAVVNSTLDTYVVDAGVEGLVVSPTKRAAKLVKKTVVGDVLPDGARLLGSLKVGEEIEATVLRFVAPRVALVSCGDVYRNSKDGGHLRVRATLPLGDTRHVVVGSTFPCYVRLAEPNSGKLTLSPDPITKDDLKKERTLARIRRQIDRGTLMAGSTRIATIVSVEGREATVDAGGLVSAVLLDPQGNYEKGDTIKVRVAHLSPSDGLCKLERVLHHHDDDDVSVVVDKEEGA